MTFVGVEQRADEVAVFDEGEVVFGFCHRDDLGLHAQVAATRHGHLQEFHALGRVGQHDAGRFVHATRLTRNFFQLFVEVHGVALQHGHVGVTVEGVESTGGVPGGAAGELIAFEQDHIGPAFFGQVVQHRAAHHAAANHHHLRACLHVQYLRCF